MNENFKLIKFAKFIECDIYHPELCTAFDKLHSNDKAVFFIKEYEELQDISNAYDLYEKHKAK